MYFMKKNPKDLSKYGCIPKCSVNWYAIDPACYGPPNKNKKIATFFS